MSRRWLEIVGHLCTTITSVAVVPHSLVSDTTDLIKDCYLKLHLIW